MLTAGLEALDGAVEPPKALGLACVQAAEGWAEEDILSDPREDEALPRMLRVEISCASNAVKPQLRRKEEGRGGGEGVSHARRCAAWSA